MGAAAFWIALAAVLIAGGWFRTRREAQRHETLRRIVEKTGQVDEERLRELIGPKPPFDWAAWHAWRRADAAANAGVGYIVLRVFGTILMFVAVGVAVFSWIYLATGAGLEQTGYRVLAASSVVGILGIGLFFASRFAEPPPRLKKDGSSGA